MTVTEAKAAHAAAATGAERAAAEIAALSRRIEDADPEGEELAELVHARALQQGRAEALRARAATAAQAVEDAERAAAREQDRRRREEVAQLDADARAISAELDTIAREAQARIAERARVLVAKVERANVLSGSSGHHRGCSWAVVRAGSELAHANARLGFLAGGQGRCCPTCGAANVADHGGPFACALCGWTT